MPQPVRLEPSPPAGLMRRVHGFWPWPIGAADNAIHEAGHLVAARAVGLPARGASIHPDGSGRACLFSSPNALAPSPLDPSIDGLLVSIVQLAFPGLPLCEAARRYSVMLCAGRQAELLHAGITLPTGTELRIHDPDHRQARLLLADTGQRLAMGWVQREARALLFRAWDKVEFIAGRLRAEGIYHEIEVTHG